MPGIALALATLLVLSMVASGSAQAQTYAEGVLYTFTGTTGNNPFAGLVMDAQGNLYGTTAGGGNPGFGTVFKLDSTGKETVLYSFANTPDGASPLGGLLRDARGNLYGTTSGGGASNSGTVFKLDMAGTETLLYSFAGSGSGDGSGPSDSLAMDAQGNLYGTTQEGGDPTCVTAFGVQSCGTVFRVDPTGKETVLYIFTGTGGDGAQPWGDLLLDAQGNLYGTTEYGGFTNAFCSSGCGTVFKLDSTGKETILYSFTGQRTGGDGANPQAGLVMDAQGNLYGTTSSGGTDNVGTVFKLDTNGNETVFYSIPGSGIVGYYPSGDLLLDAQGNLYGTTLLSGPQNGGAVFEVNPSGSGTALYGFSGRLGDGSYSTSSLVRDAQGDLYGTTRYGGDQNCSAAFPGPPGTLDINCGTVFKLVPYSVSGATAAPVSPGGTTTATITVTPSSGFTGSVALTATITSFPAGTTDSPTLSFGSTSPVTVTNGTAGTATLTISTTAASPAAFVYPYPARPGTGWYSASGATMVFVLGIFLLSAALLGAPVQSRNWRTKLGLLALPVILTGGLLGCGKGAGGGGRGGVDLGTPPGNYIVTVSATSGGAVATTTITVTVQ